MDTKTNQPNTLGIQIAWSEFPNASMGDALYASLRRAIVAGNIPPGTPITEMDISRETRVSRTPVREAVRKLESERLLLRMPGRKLMVTSPNRTEMEEIFLVRSVLEGLAGRIAASKMNRSHIESLKKIEKTMGRGATENELALAIKSNLEFHKLIVDICDVNVLTETLKRFWDTVRMMSMTNLDDRTWIQRSMKEHQKIIDSLERKDGPAAERLIRNHVIHAGRIFTAAGSPVKVQGKKKSPDTVKGRGKKGKARDARRTAGIGLKSPE
ncbi:MAG: GntR family transcriptional regulator [Syntrophales bacterium]